jgi:hypothetical protein
MATPAMFPGRVNDRRVRALARLQVAIAANAPSKMTRADRVALADRTALKLDANARATRTKKNRASHARASR